MRFGKALYLLSAYSAMESDISCCVELGLIGEGATELVHIGQAVIAHGGKLDYFIDTVFNYPTLAECYKVAALAALNKFPTSNAVCAVE